MQIIAHLDYSSVVKQRSLGPENFDDGTDPSSVFLDALRIRAMDEMHKATLEYGIVLKDVGGFFSSITIKTFTSSRIPTAVIDREFKGEIVSTMNKLTTRAFQAKWKRLWGRTSTENSNKVTQEEGALAVARKAQACDVCTDVFYWVHTT
ncbi:hypothetical protein JVU11DRAFT_7264 [Chiua virens]|nr:hypothetical protein JVU11DRAFT_7264 [Chiua virens]